MVPHPWQKINADRHSCHWWQDLCRSMISAMETMILILALVSGFALLARYVHHDSFSGAEMPTGGDPRGIAAGQDVLR